MHNAGKLAAQINTLSQELVQARKVLDSFKGDPESSIEEIEAQEDKVYDLEDAIAELEDQLDTLGQGDGPHGWA